MLKVLAACGNGMGSSLIIKMRIEKVLEEMEIVAKVEHASVSDAKARAKDYDLVLVSEVFIGEFSEVKGTKVIGLLNLLSEIEIRAKVEQALD